MNTTTIQKWGNSYAVRLPKDLILELNLQAGNLVKIYEVIKNKSISIIPIRNNDSLKSLEYMVSKISKKNQHVVTDFGSPVGKEAW